MDTRDKINVLSQAAELEAADTFAPPPPGPGERNLYPGVTHVAGPGGRSVPILKVLQSNACRNNCRYCAFRAGRDYHRVHLTPDELARSVDLMYRAGVVQGVFLSSGIGDAVKSMDDMLATADLLRSKYAFRGYLHLKLLPGVEADQVAQAVMLADRVSTNLEAPGQERLALLAPEKRIDALVKPLASALQTIARLRAGGPVGSARSGKDLGLRSLCLNGAEQGVGQARLGMSTQFVVGPAGESDRELLDMAAALYRDLRLTRAYYSPFRPVAGTPLQDAPPTDGRRQHRLYQADWLVRFYHFVVDELAFNEDGQLDAAVDPKAAWARQHPERFPIEVNRAPLEELLRIPGIGPASARAITRARQQGPLRTLGDLRRLGARADQAAPYVLLAGHLAPYQMRLPLEQERS